MSELVPGLRAELRRVVTADLTAEALGSGDVPVLGTPAVLAMMEAAAVAALAPALPPGTTSVGARADLTHLAPSRPGAEILATAEVTAVEGRAVELECEAHDGDRLVARMTHRRAVVDRERFLARLPA